ncbi:hypothetical protein [Kitasatospora aureofaciens]|uniref:hypothetical protein n=1 Tax=Kitasatospora aureofaciens TaxID=1894 RepID=UPI00340BB2A2
MQTDTTRITVWVQFSAASLLEKMIRQHRAEEHEYVETLIEQGLKKREARIQAAALRPERWPSIGVVVADALDLRLTETDLAGPWAPLTAAEAARLSLSGSWPGPWTGQHLVQRNYSLPTPLVNWLRTVSWRKSQDALQALEDRGLVGRRVLTLNEAEQRDRLHLAAQLYPPGRIVREALERYGPIPAKPTADRR